VLEDEEDGIGGWGMRKGEIKPKSSSEAEGERRDRYESNSTVER
jgi:hypothetical protein